jgi:hypothetical protein
LHDLFCATSDGFRSKVSCILLLRLSIVRSTLLGVIFCLDISPFFFFSCSLAGCFSFIYLFIGLFILNPCNTNVGLVYTYECNSLVLSTFFN